MAGVPSNPLGGATTAITSTAISTTAPAVESPGLMHRLSVVGEYLNRGAIELLATPGYVVDAVNHSPRLLNVIPGVELGPMAERPFLGSAMIRDNLTGAHDMYKVVAGVETPVLLDDTDRAIAATAEIAGGVIPTLGAGGIVSGSRAIAANIAKLRPMDIVADFLTGGTRAAQMNFMGAQKFGSLAAAEAAGLRSANAFTAAASTIPGSGTFAANTVSAMMANTALTGTRLATVGGLNVAKHAALFSLRHPFLTAGTLATADMTMNNGRLTGAATRGAANLVTDKMLGLGPLFAASSVPALTPALPNIDMTRWLAANNNTPIVKRIEEGLGIDIPDEWEQRGNQLMRDFGNSSFGQWLVGGSWGSKILMGLLAFMLFDGIKDRLIGNDMGTNMLSLSVGVLAAQMLPELLKAMTEQPAAPAEELLRPQALDFAPSNSGAALGGMSFAPAP